VRVFLGAPSGERSTESPARFTVEANVSAISDTLKISIHLLDGNTQHHVWGRHFRCKHSDPQCSAQLDELAQTLAATVAEEQGILARHLYWPPQREQVATYEAVLRYYHHEITQSASTYREALAALRHAVDVEPKNVLAWSFLHGCTPATTRWS
jgi:hypothetical protein